VVNFHISGINEPRPGHGTPWVNFGTIPAIPGRLATLVRVRVRVSFKVRNRTPVFAIAPAKLHASRISVLPVFIEALTVIQKMINVCLIY